jgi:hypothetical protein
MSSADAERTDASTPVDLAGSARGWHGVQLAVLAFIGVCGVLSDSDPTSPRWLQILAGVLAIAALVLACASIFLVASVAWPTREARTGPEAARRLRLGVTLTYTAVAVMALAASSGWWPTKEEPTTSNAAAGGAPVVQITDGSGSTACGELVAGPAGRIRITTADGPVELATSGLAAIEPVDSC